MRDGGSSPIDGGVLELPANPPGDHAACAVAKVAAYDSWQEAVAAAKKSAAAAEGQCADVWSEKKKQARYYAATSWCALRRPPATAS